MCVLARAFIRRSQWLLPDIIRLFLALPCAPVHLRAFFMHPNWPLLDIIHQSRGILCVHYGLKWVFVVDLPIPCVLNFKASNPPKSDVNYSYKWALEGFINCIVSLQITTLFLSLVSNSAFEWHILLEMRSSCIYKYTGSPANQYMLWEENISYLCIHSN